MASISCPHCGEKTFSWWDKYLTGKWGLLHCRQCRGRVCAQPIVLALLYFLYVWDVVLFGFLAYLDSLWYLLVMAAGWLILDYFSIYVPLTALRAKPSHADQAANTTPGEAQSDALSNVVSKDS